MAGQNKTTFREVQRFALWLRLAIVASMVFAVVVDSFALCQMLSQQDSPQILPVISLIVFGILLPVAVAVLFFMLKMETEVRSDGLHVRFFPLHIRYKNSALKA